ncbi:thermonuclease family protein [Brucella anthropi]|uniref:thermonuclease family protein n=1 Tax=Brucella anthropi TaxID=529 RepID=UPI00178C6B33|nr:thermonuclease family protein [Brucella anthropi]
MKIWAPATIAIMSCINMARAAEAPALPNAEPLRVSDRVQIITGDTWRDRDRLYRLYGVQSCLRGTIAVGKGGSKIDCGNVSLAHLAAIFSSSPVTCQPIGFAQDEAVFVVCGADMKGETVDLGTALISTGNAFAATDAKGNAVVPSYLVAEISAKMNTTGLWSGQFQHPKEVLLKSTRQQKNE